MDDSISYRLPSDVPISSEFDIPESMTALESILDSVEHALNNNSIPIISCPGKNRTQGQSIRKARHLIAPLKQTDRQSNDMPND